jgi:hypothetical protein
MYIKQVPRFIVAKRVQNTLYNGIRRSELELVALLPVSSAVSKNTCNCSASSFMFGVHTHTHTHTGQ